MLMFWKEKVMSSFVDWMRKNHPSIKEIDQNYGKLESFWEGHYCWANEGRGQIEYRKWWTDRLMAGGRDRAAGAEVVARPANASWWDWDDRSRAFHWRWPEDYQDRIRDGLPINFRHEPPRYRKEQRDVKDPVTKEKVVRKLDRVRQRRYIAPGYVVSLTSFFEVPKGADDIRMVYDGSVSGLNDSMWVPRFALPTLETHLRSVEAGTFLADVDVGEMFLNFILHNSVRQYSGVNLTSYFLLENGGKVWETWQRAAMGLKSSPYQACQAMGFAEEGIHEEIGSRRLMYFVGIMSDLTFPDLRLTILIFHGC
jgi:hypothetical protein